MFSIDNTDKTHSGHRSSHNCHFAYGLQTCASRTGMDSLYPCARDHGSNTVVSVFPTETSFPTTQSSFLCFHYDLPYYTALEMVYSMALPGLSLLSKFIPNEAQKIQIEVHLGPKFKFGFHCAYFHESHDHSINFPGQPLEFFPNRIKMWKTGGNLIYALSDIWRHQFSLAHLLCSIMWRHCMPNFTETGQEI